MSTNETQVTIRGRLCADPNVFTTRAGAPMTKFRVAQSGRRQVQPGQWEDTEPSFYDVLAYRSLAANIGVSLRKGHPVTVHGRQRVVQWRREDGQVFVNVEIEADAVGHDLTYGTTAFAKVGLGRASESWSSAGAASAEGGGAGPGGGFGSTTGHDGIAAPGSFDGPDSPGAPGRPEDGAGLGNPEDDPYVVDAGPLVPSAEEDAA